MGFEPTKQYILNLPLYHSGTLVSKKKGPTAIRTRVIRIKTECDKPLHYRTSTLGGTRTHNRTIRSRARYPIAPLGHYELRYLVKMKV